MTRRWEVLVAAIALASCRQAQHDTETSVTPVRVVAVELFEPKTAERYSASIAPGRQVALAFRLGGYIQQVHTVRSNDGHGRALEPGDVVEQGTVLARLRPDDYDIQVNQATGQMEAASQTEKGAQAQLAQATAAHIKAQADFDRAKKLLEAKSLTRPEFDAAKAQFDATQAQVEAARSHIEAAGAQKRTAQAAVGSAELAKRDSLLTAPFTAAVVQRTVEVGMLAVPGMQAYTLADISSVKATFGVPDTVAVRLKPGASLALSVEALPDRTFRGTITTIAAVADRETRLFQVEVSLPNTDRLLRPGMIASLSLGQTAPVAAVPVVPLSAIIRDRTPGSSFAVMVVNGKIARERPVKLGPTYGDRLAITEGLKPGELVVRAGATMIRDGEPVEVIP